MVLTDLILFPLYVLFFHLVFFARRKRMDDPILKKYHKQGFWVKVASAIAFTFFYTVITKGDTTVLYYTEGINITKLILKDIRNIKLLFIQGVDFDQNLLANTFNRGYFKNESNYFVTKLVAIFSFFSFGSYAVINLFFSMISFSGVWRLYKFFYEQYPKLHKQFALVILFLPNFIFWSSGILKDPLCTGMLGWLTYSAYCAFKKRTSVIKNITIAVIAAYVLLIVKAYILAAYIPFFALYLVLSRISIMKSVVVKLLALFTVTVIVSITLFFLSGKIENLLGDYALDKITESVKTSQEGFANIADVAESSFSLGADFDGSPASLIHIAPAAVTASLFRPYIWESKKISTLLSALESLAFIIFTLYVLYKARLRFFIYIFKDPVIMYCFWYAILFAMFVGAIALNFGTLVRYKIPCIPFYLAALILILNRVKTKKGTVVKDDAAIA